MSRYSVWFPAGEWPRIKAEVEAMNAPDTDEPRLWWPVDPWPAKITLEENGDATYSGDDPRGADGVVGDSIGCDAFQKDGWTPIKFALFAISRAHLHVDVAGRSSATLAALAGYLRTPVLIRDDLESFQRISFITADGDVTTADYTGDPNEFAAIRTSFFAHGLSAALDLPGLTVHPQGPAALPCADMHAWNRQTLLRDWQREHAGGKLAAPKGAELSHADFKFLPSDDIDRERPVVAYARSSKHLYEVLYPVDEQVGPLELLCAVDGVLQRYADPDTGIEKGLGAYGAYGTDWADWILTHSVPEGHRTEKEPWEGNGTEARLYRMEHNIVGYEDHETGTSQFGTAVELETWLRKSLNHHTAPLTVHLLDDVAMMLDAESMPVLQKHTYERSAGEVLKILRSKAMFFPWSGFGNWESSGHGGYSRNPTLETVMDGEDFEFFEAVNCLDANALAPYLLPEGTPVTPNSWFLLGVGDTRTCILFPAVGSMLQVSTDHDGASARIVAREYVSRRRELDDEHAFRTRWAPWLDDEHQLTREEIRQGLETLDRLIKENSK